MRIFHIATAGVTEHPELPGGPIQGGFLWVSCTRLEFEQRLAELQALIQSQASVQLVDLHVSDLLNAQLPSHFDYTSQYDLLVFRRLASGAHPPVASPNTQTAPRSQLLPQVDTSAVGFAVFENLLLSVHPSDCFVRDAYAARLLTSSVELRTANSRLPTSPADLMLRITNLMVDAFLDLRRELSRLLEHWQARLLQPSSRFTDWHGLLALRLSLNQLDEICEDQRQAVLDWIEAMEEWPDTPTPADQRELDLLKVRSRDLLEHIERVVHHVRRLEHNIETAIQMHFSAQGNRTNDIMRTLTVLTAIFLPLNLIAGIFGMNFDVMPWSHSSSGFWWTLSAMALTACGLALLFWRKRYLERSAR